VLSKHERSLRPCLRVLFAPQRLRPRDRAGH
jgi:hypothetical protein